MRFKTLSNLSFEALLLFLEGSTSGNHCQYCHNISLDPILKPRLSSFSSLCYANSHEPYLWHLEYACPLKNPSVQWKVSSIGWVLSDWQ
jgi:hypothetical protein